MASALFLGSWAALMGPMIYGMSALANQPRFATSLRLLPSTLVVDLVAVAAAPHAPISSTIVADH
jgi:hypothetical protein